jgi:catalase-peroxidase
LYVAWSSASTFRGSDKRGGANGGRIRLAPQKNWKVNQPERLQKVLEKLLHIQTEFAASHSGSKTISMADLIVLGGCAAVERAAKNGGYSFVVPFTSGRTDASQEDTDVESFAVLEPVADGFRNYHNQSIAAVPEELLIDKAQLLTLTAPEMTVLIGGLRVLGVNFDDSRWGRFTHRNDTLSNDFFVHLLDMDIEWSPTSTSGELFQGKDRATGEITWEATRVDLVFGSHSQLRAIAEEYACDDANQHFVKDFIAAWDKVMQLDRFEMRGM